MGRVSLICALAMVASACSSTPEDDPPRDLPFYVITQRIRIDPSVFEPRPGLPVITPLDEAVIAFQDQVSRAPGDWQYSETTENRDRDGFQQNGAAFFGIVPYPNAEFTITRRARLPSFSCVWMLVPTNYEFVRDQSNVAMALSSNCTPIPSSFEDISVTAALDELPSPDGTVPGVFDLTIDTQVNILGYATQSPFSDAVYLN